MIKTDWKKCDNKYCKNVAFIHLRNSLYQINVKVCPLHYEEVKKMGDWDIIE